MAWNTIHSFIHVCITQVLIYSGQLDIIVAAPLSEAMLQTVPWSHLQGYKEAKRTVWKIHDTDTEVAGYVRTVENFAQVRGMASQNQECVSL